MWGDRMSLDEVLADAVNQIPECLAGGYVDMSTGILLGASTADEHSQEIFEMVSSATANLFQGEKVIAIETHFKKTGGLKKDSGHYIQEIVILSDHLIHAFIRTQKHPNHAICFVSRKDTNIGIMLTKARFFLGPISAMV